MQITMNINTTEQGDKFSDEVASILSTKFSNIRREVRVSGKRADILFESESIIGNELYAVECKSQNDKLSPREVEDIVSEYNPAKRNEAISGLLIVSKHQITPKAQEGLPGWAILKTIEQLYEEILGVKDYVDFLINDFENSELEKYYIPIEFGDSVDAFDDVISWANNDDVENGLAILGGYGTGKTSFSKFLAARIAEQYRKNTSKRIPIRIKLGNFSRRC